MALTLPFGNELFPLLVVGLLLGFLTNDKQKWPLLSDPFFNFVIGGIFVSANYLLELVGVAALVPAPIVVFGASYSFGSLVERAWSRGRKILKK